MIVGFHRILFVFLFFSICILSRGGYADSYLPEVDDVPLMEGLTVVEAAEDFSFDTPAGRIIVVNAVSDHLTAADVLLFYQKTLPALGWISKGDGLFTRDRDSLQVRVLKNKNPHRVQFELSLMTD